MTQIHVSLLQVSESTYVSVFQRKFIWNTAENVNFCSCLKKRKIIFRVKITPESWYSSLNQIGIGHVTSDQ